MIGPGSAWTVRLTDVAAEDFSHVLAWSRERFGDRQARVYAETVSATLRELSSGPEQLGVKVREDIGKGLLALHVARHGRRGRHFVLFRVADQRRKIIEILRVLHDAMDLPRHLPPASGTE